MAAVGSTVVFGTHRSTDGGVTWANDAHLAGPTWKTTVNGKLVGTTSVGTSYTAVVYDIATGTQLTYPMPQSWAMNDTWAIRGTLNGLFTATNFVTGAVQPVVPSPSSSFVVAHIEITGANGLVWTGVAGNGRQAFAYSTSLSATPGAWVEIPDIVAHAVSLTQLVYVRTTPTSFDMCARPLTSLTSPETCSTLATGEPTAAAGSLYSFGSSVVSDITGAMLSGASVPGHALWNGSAATPIPLPTNAEIQQPPAGGENQFGDTPYIVTGGTSVPTTLHKVAANGTLVNSPTIPPVNPAVVTRLAVTPTQVVGADTRNGPDAPQAWQRTTSAAGFGTEDLLSPGAALGASADNVVLSDGSNVTVVQNGQVVNSFYDAGLDQVSGPYFSLKTANFDPSVSNYAIRNLYDWSVGGFYGVHGTLYGSEFVTWTTDAQPTGAAHLVVHDLTGIAADRGVTLPAGSATCGAAQVWSNVVVMACGVKIQAFSLATGALLKTLSGQTGQSPAIASVGDGYALVTLNGTDYVLWTLSSGATTPLTDCVANVVSDGAGHVACSSATELIWRDFSSVSTSAPRLLGSIVNPYMYLSVLGRTYPLHFDASKAMSAGQVVLTNSEGTVVRTMSTPASPDGGISLEWDGLDATGKPVPIGTYTYRLVANAADGSGTVVSVDGSGQATGTFTVITPSQVGKGPGAFMPMVPARVMDTRIDYSGGKVAAKTTRTVTYLNTPLFQASAVALNVTVTNTTSSGYLTVFPHGAAQPTASNLNWSSAGATVPNAVIVPLGTSDQVDLYQSGPGSADVIVDVVGYFVSGTVTDAGGFVGLAPSRILDTRTGDGTVTASQTRDLQVTGTGGVPASNVSAVVLNVTVTDTTSGGYLTAFPKGAARPLVSNLNWTSGATIPNLVVVKVGDAGKVSLYQSGPGSAQVIADVAGYYLGGTPTSPGTFVALTPSRVLDTRTTGKVAGSGDVLLTVTGKGGIPSAGVAAVVVNTTVTETTAGGYLTVYPGNMTMPTASNLNWSGPGTTVPNLVTSPIGSNGTLKFHNGSPGTTHVIADAAGYYLA